jgi:hypothetical protein
MCFTCFEGVLLSWIPFTSFVLSRNTTSQLLIMLWFLHTSSDMHWSLHNSLEHTQDMDLDFNLLSLSSRMCVHMLCNKKLSNVNHWASIGQCFLWGFWVSLLWFGIDSWCKLLCPLLLLKTPSWVLGHESCS